MLSTQFKFDHARKLFFDSQKVIDVIGKKEAGVLSRAGRFVQRKARGLIRRRKKPSKPGSSPTNQTDRYRSSILFFADLKNRSVVIGPTQLNRSSFDGDPVTGEVPSVLEAGGQINLLETQLFPGAETWTRRRSRRNSGGKTRLRTVTIEPRPHMQPAFEAELPKFPSLFRGN